MKEGVIFYFDSPRSLGLLIWELIQVFLAWKNVFGNLHLEKFISLKTENVFKDVIINLSQKWLCF